jgi:hypothetical protein
MSKPLREISPVIETPVIALDQRAGDRQAQARAAIGSLAGEERFENARDITRRNARTIISQRQSDDAWLLYAGDRDGARAGLARIVDQRCKDGFKRRSVDGKRGQVRRQGHVNRETLRRHSVAKPRENLGDIAGYPDHRGPHLGLGQFHQGD